MAKINNINNSSFPLTVDPTAVSDSFNLFSVNATPLFIQGVDQSAPSAYKICQGSSLGTNDRFIINSSGDRTLPSQSCFLTLLLAGGVGTANDVTGDGTVYTMAWDTNIFDQDTNVVGSTFTAPIAGKYRFFGSIFYSQVNNIVFDDTMTQIVTTNRSFNGAICNPFVVLQTVGVNARQGTLLFSVITDMDVSDTCTVTAMVSGGAKTVDVGSVASAICRGWFCGYLSC